MFVALYDSFGVIQIIAVTAPHIVERGSPDFKDVVGERHHGVRCVLLGHGFEPPGDEVEVFDGERLQLFSPTGAIVYDSDNPIRNDYLVHKEPGAEQPGDTTVEVGEEEKRVPMLLILKEDVTDLINTVKGYIDGDVPIQGVETIIDEFEGDYLNEECST